MSNKNADISQIKKYLAGKLDARAMHELEKRAQNDPFLTDALEGYEKTGVNEQQLIDLTGRLQQRISQKRGRVIPFRRLAMAASVIAVLTVGGLWIYNRQQPATPPLAAQVDKAEVQPSPAIKRPGIIANHGSIIKNNPVAVLKSAARPSVMRSKRIAANETERVAPDTGVSMLSTTLDKTEHPVAKVEEKGADIMPLNEMVVMNYNNQQKADTKIAADANVANAAAGRASGIRVTAVGKNVLQGKVVSKSDGLALPGVTVKVSGTSVAVVTDANGRFTLNADSNKAKQVEVAFLGFRTQRINVSSQALSNIALEPETSTLNEVVTVGYGSRKKAVATAAHPHTGWSSFKKYLKDEAISPDGKTGTVTLQFMVNSDGTLTGFKVIKSVSDAADEKAAALIKNGPGWIGNANGEAKQATVKIRFHK